MSTTTTSSSEHSHCNNVLQNKKRLAIMRIGRCDLPNPVYAYTKRIPPEESSSIIVDSGIGIPVYLLRQGTPPGQKVKITAKALVDTGCSRTSISKRLATACKLIPFRKTRMENAGGIDIVNVYTVDIFLPNKVRFNNVSVAEYVDNNRFDIIIGMDILKHLDLSITNANGQMMFSIRQPPDAFHIDYEKLQKKDKSAKIMKEQLKKKQVH